MDPLLVKEDAVDERGVFDGPALALLHLDVGEVNQTFVVLDDANGVHGSNTNVGHEGLDRSGGFSGQGRFSDFLEHCVVVFSGNTVIVHQSDGALGGQAEPFADDGWMDVLFNQVLASLEQFARKDDRRGGTVKAVLLLGFGNFNDHFGGWMFDVHFLQDGRTVVGDHHVAHRIDQHFVHAFGTERGANGIGHSLGGCDVVGLSGAPASSLRTVLQDEDGCLSVSIHVLALRHVWRGCLRLEPYAWSAWMQKGRHCWFCSSHC